LHPENLISSSWALVAEVSRVDGCEYVHLTV